MALPSLEQLNSHLSTQSYLGGSLEATLYDYDYSRKFSQREIYSEQFPHFMRWHSHITSLIARYGNYDCRGNPLSNGTAPALPNIASNHYVEASTAESESHEQMDSDIEARWNELQARAPMPHKGKPTPEQITASKTHKDELRKCLAEVGDKVAKQLMGKHKNMLPQKPLEQQHVSLEAKTKEFSIVPRSHPVSVWDGTPSLTFTAVLPFYSHSSRSKDFERVDTALGIDRRVFSNLYTETDGKLYHVPEAPASMGGAHLMRHAFLAEIAGSSSEAFFQAAKCELEADARFIMELSSLDAAKYGQGRLTPNEQQLKRLEELGLKTEFGLECPNAAYRGQNATVGELRRIPQRRIDWEEVKMDVMMHVCRCKFGIGCSSDSPTQAAASLAALAASEHTWLLIEHPRLDGDRAWGDGGDGKGSNMLGKCLSRLVLELRGAPSATQLPSFDQVRALNNTIVDYKSH